jgi:transcriptional regulator NrdR family protein
MSDNGGRTTKTLGMPCIVCGEPTEVLNTRRRPPESEVHRLRQCRLHHSFRTTETPNAPSLSAFAVRRSSDGQLASEPFSRTTLSNDIYAILFKKKGPLDVNAIEALVDRVIRRIDRELPTTRTRLTAEEFRRHTAIVGAIPDVTISNAVEEELRSGDGGSFRVAELLYVMAIHGRNDNREGWADAKSVMSWVRQRYPGISPRPQRGRRGEQGAPSLAAPRRMMWRPEAVMKREGTRPPFRVRQLQKGIQAALWGREDAEAKAMMVAHLVLSDIRSQRVVQSTQLSASVLTHLRRVDDIGYLRWSTIVKNIRGVEELTEETADLIHIPSPRLRVTKDWRRWARSQHASRGNL